MISFLSSSKKDTSEPVNGDPQVSPTDLIIGLQSPHPPKVEDGGDRHVFDEFTDEFLIKT